MINLYLGKSISTEVCNVPFFGSLLVVEERMRSSGCIYLALIDDRKVIRPQSLYINYSP